MAGSLKATVVIKLSRYFRRSYYRT